MIQKLDFFIYFLFGFMCGSLCGLYLIQEVEKSYRPTGLPQSTQFNSNEKIILKVEELKDAINTY